MENNVSIKELITKMTLEEKAGMCSGGDFWHTKAVERLGIPAIMVSDGPHGLRKQEEGGDHLGVNDSIKAVCFPAGCANASSFDRELLYNMGEHLGKECQAEGVSVLLGPAINMKRSPLCGRNFEYMSEDPYLAGELAASLVNGVQSQNVGTSVKHFAANNQEYRRMSASSEIDERTLREIYLPAFETVVKKSQPFTVMCSYNQVNGVFASENHRLLTEILRNEWGFKGFVVSDWGAVNQRILALEAGLELEMPSSNGITDAEIVEAVESGKMKEEVLNQAVERILNIVYKCVEHRQKEVFDRDKDHLYAVKVEEESAVLLKNENQILPIKKGSRVAVIGEFAKKPRFQGGGSSHINSHRVSNALAEMEQLSKQGISMEITYARGFSSAEDKVEKELCEEAVKAASEADLAVIFAGLPDSFESEGYDRKHMGLPQCQNSLIEAVSRVQSNIVVVLHNGSPVEMPWADQVKGILELYLGGQGVGQAAARLLFGLANPSGKLAETFPVKLEHNPSYLTFPGDGKTVEYQEGIYIGYRYYDKKKLLVQFPFGHGLSYTAFEYGNIEMEKEAFSSEEEIKVSIEVKNTGGQKGKEAVQLYVSDHTNVIHRPEKELKGFEKIELEPGESKKVEFRLNKRSFSWYSTELEDWFCGTGEYEIQIGASSADIRQKKAIRLKGNQELPIEIHANTTMGELMGNSKTRPMVMAMLEKQKELFEGEASQAAAEAITEEMNIQMMDSMPLRALRSFQGMTSQELVTLISQLQELLKK